MWYVVYLTRDAWEADVLSHFPQFVSRTENFDDSFYRWLLYISPYSRIFEFIGGVLTCQLFRLVRRQRRFDDGSGSGAMAWLAIVVMAILFGFFRYFGEYNPWLEAGNHSLGGFIVNLHMNFLFAPACYLLIFSLALGAATIGRVLASRPTRFLGDISYSTYLSHPMAERILMHTGLVVVSTALHVLAIMVVIYIMSWILYSIVEVPAKRGLRKLLMPQRLTAASARGGG
jgi:peptidoglycan/LPS O-acetylase OafA/YrhL